MKSFISRTRGILSSPLTGTSTVLVIIAVLILIPTFFLPLWNLEFWSYQYPDSLTLDIYSHKLVGGNDGADLAEINILNHYIGMAELHQDAFPELKWVPLALGLFIILTLRAAVFGAIGKLVDILVLFSYFGMFSLWSFWYKLNYFGHNLDARAAVKVEPFSPPLFGFEQVGQFKVWSYPSYSSYLLFAFVLLLALSIIISARAAMKKPVSN
jgi:copper chaperone NosL